MLSDDLFKQVLVDPALSPGVDRLRIVSGFATVGMAFKHTVTLSELGRPFSVDLIIGMTKQSGIVADQHHEFRQLSEEEPNGVGFNCRYVVEGGPVHAKTYCWFSGKKPVIAFSGSANYTLTGFGKSQIETMASVDPAIASRFYETVFDATADCLDKDIAEKVTLTEYRRFDQAEGDHALEPEGEKIHLSLLDAKTGDTPARSGINWGQRNTRNSDEAYIHIPAPIQKTDFFPERSVPFTMLTDDGVSFIMVRAQDKGKGLETKESNALLGRYLRDRMGVPSGEYVTRQHLDEYGRSDVSITKIDDETYLLDFQPKQ